MFPYEDRSSHRRCSIKKGVLKSFSKFKGKYLYQSLFFPATLLKNRLWHRCFPVNSENFLRIPFLQNTSGRLLLWRLFQTSQLRFTLFGLSFFHTAHTMKFFIKNFFGKFSFVVQCQSSHLLFSLKYVLKSVLAFKLHVFFISNSVAKERGWKIKKN